MEELSIEGLKELEAWQARERTGGRGPHCIVQFDVRVNGMICKGGRPDSQKDGEVPCAKLVQEEPPGAKLKFGGMTAHGGEAGHAGIFSGYVANCGTGHASNRGVRTGPQPPGLPVHKKMGPTFMGTP